MVQTRSSHSPPGSEGEASSMPLSSKRRTKWSVVEEATLIEFFSKQSNTTKNSNRTFKPPVYTEAAGYLHKFYGDDSKNAESCKNKMRNVREFFFVCVLPCILTRMTSCSMIMILSLF